MSDQLELPDDLRARIEAIAARSSLTPSQVVADALENGHSLEWQERFLERVASGLAEADQGDFASAREIETILNKYRPS